MRYLKNLLCIFFIIMLTSSVNAQSEFEKDQINTGKGILEMHFIGHGTLMFSYNGLIIHIDPVSGEADYSKLPDADIILITHEHGDHLDPAAIRELTKTGTVIICNKASSSALSECNVMNNGDKMTVKGIDIEAVLAYNIVNERSPGNPFHPKGNGNGYIIEAGNKRIYIGGDTEKIPEMKDFGRVDIAFLPMNLPYTMTPEMASEAARILNPEILYPYHFGSSDTDAIVKLLDGTGIDVRIRKLQ